MRTAVRTLLGLGTVAFVIASPAPTLVRDRDGIAVAETPPGDACLVEIHDQSGALPDGTTLCQTPTDGVCSFDLQVCQSSDGQCTPAEFKTHVFHATGCGPVTRLRASAQSAGTDSMCGPFTTINVRARPRLKPRRCTIRTEVRSAT